MVVAHATKRTIEAWCMGEEQINNLNWFLDMSYENEIINEY